ncbi:MAG: histidine kinase dimerization/phospho-acceptor domain-containing protein, partial [Acidimicrobiales bacterium]
MTRRLTFAIVGMVAASLILAGLGTLVLERIGARQAAESELVAEVADIAAAADGVQLTGVQALSRLRRALHLEDIALLFIGPGGAINSRPPSGVERADLDVDALRAGEVLSGRSGSLVWAAAPATVQRRGQPVVAVLVATRSTTQGTGAAVRWFLLAAAGTMAVGVLVATRLGRALTGPVREAQAATERIAGGDLAARLSDPPDGDNGELAGLARSINTMAATLERSKGLERQFLLSVSHDLRTPLTSIRGYAEAIADGTVADTGAAAGVITAEARRLERLVRDLLDLARLDARQFSLDWQPVDLVDIAAGTADGFRHEAEDAGVSLGVDV